MTSGPQYREGQRLEIGAHRSEIRRLQRWVAVVAALATFGTFAGAAGLWTGRHEASVRNGQFCHLINATHADRVHRYLSTLDYLRSPAGRAPLALNTYIRRVSLPQSRQEIRREAALIPPTCRDPKQQ